MKQQALLDHDPAARREHDFYASPRWQVEALVSRLRLPLLADVLEPCAGDGAISKVLARHGCRVWSNDIVDRGYPLDSMYDLTRPANWLAMLDEMGARGGCDAGITNLPFNLAFEIVPHAIKLVPIFACILRRTFDEPTKARCEWLAANPPYGQIVLPRWNYRSADGKGGGDSTTTAWFIWSRQRNELVRPIDYVTWAERDALLAQEQA